MSTARRQNKRKRELESLKRSMRKQGFTFKKIVKNRVTFRNSGTGEKVRLTIGSYGTNDNKYQTQ